MWGRSTPCWEVVPVPQTRKDSYLEEVGRQIRWPLARRLLLRELGDHIEDQRRDLDESGLEGDAALQRAVEEMGDPVEVGRALDRLHRPKGFWWVMGLIALLAVLGAGIAGVMYRGYSTSPLRQLVFGLVGVGLCLVLSRLDYTFLYRGRTLRWGLILLGGLLAARVFDTFSTWTLWTPQLITRSSFYLILFLPTALGALLCRIKRGRPWQLLLCGLGIPLLSGFVLLGSFTFYIYLPCLAMCVLLCLALRQGRFVCRPALGAVLALGPSLVAGIYFYVHSRLPLSLAALLDPTLDPKGLGFAVGQFRQLISSLPPVNLSGTLPPMPPGATLFLQIDYLFIRLAAICGWLVLPLALGLTLLVCALFLRRLVRVRNPEGKLLGFAAGLPLVLQAVTYTLFNCGVFLGGILPFPFLAYGPTFALLNSVLLGLVLSVLRHDGLPFPAVAPLQVPRVTIRLDAK